MTFCFFPQPQNSRVYLPSSGFFSPHCSIQMCKGRFQVSQQQLWWLPLPPDCFESQGGRRLSLGYTRAPLLPFLPAPSAPARRLEGV